MTPEEYRKWSAERVMGWVLIIPDFEDEWDHSSYTNPNKPRWYLPKKDWRPDDPTTGQIWMFVEKMRELGWKAQIWVMKDDYRVLFFKGFHDWRHAKQRDYTINTDKCLAILEAGHNAVEGK